MKKKFFFLLLQLIIYFHWAVLLLWLVVELVDSRFCIRNMSIIVFFSLLFDVVVPLLFFLTQFSIAIDFAVSFTPFFRYSVYVSSECSVTNEFGKRKKNRTKYTQYTCIRMKLCRKFNRQWTKKYFERIDRKSFGIVELNCTDEAHSARTHTQFVQIMCVCPVIKQTSCEQNEKEANGSIDKLFISYD